MGLMSSDVEEVLIWEMGISDCGRVLVTVELVEEMLLLLWEMDGELAGSRHALVGSRVKFPVTELVVRELLYMVSMSRGVVSMVLVEELLIFFPDFPLTNLLFSVLRSFISEFNF